MVEKRSDLSESETTSPLGGVLHRLGVVVFERRDSGKYVLSSPSKGWLGFLLEGEPKTGQEVELLGRCEFLDHFLEDSEENWGSSEAQWRKSGVWTEKTPAGSELHLEATTLEVDGSYLLLLENLTEKYRERSDLLQKARESVLNYQSLVREIEGNEILLHCIVHDLSGPLMGIDTCLSWFDREELSEAGLRRLRTGRKAAAKVRSLMDDMLHAFAAEHVAAGDAGEDPPSTDALLSVRSVIEILEPAALLRDVRIVLEPSGEGRDWAVVGERARLERVFFNLIDNALRHSAAGGRVMLRLRSGEGEIEAEVEDEGAGVSPSLENQLFRKFLRGEQGTGKVGLGLYFCRIVVERWGGSIGHRRGDSGGACFWFRLPRVETN